MKHFKVDLYDYFGLDKKGNGGILTAYIPDDVEWLDKKIRPAMLVIPGGAYSTCAEREKEPVALKFMFCGFAAFTLEYSVLTAYPVPLCEAVMAVAYLRGNKDRLGISKIAVTGFSAGGHLAGLLVTATADELSGFLNGNIKIYLPDAAVLCYPVVTLKDGITHQDTRKNITGGDMSLYGRLSVENRITEISPPFFIWHTAGDDCVSVENALLLASACRKAEVPFSLHVFENGGHGLSLCSTETDNQVPYAAAKENVGKWVDIAADWLFTHGFTVNNRSERKEG